MSKNSKKIADKIASRTIESYLMLKVPVGYSLMKNTKALIESQLGEAPTDDELEEIYARFLDLVIFGLMRDVKEIGTSFPEPNHFYDVVKEVMQESSQDQDDDDQDFYSQFRFDADMDDEGQEMAAPKMKPTRF